MGFILGGKGFFEIVFIFKTQNTAFPKLFRQALHVNHLCFIFDAVHQGFENLHVVWKTAGEVGYGWRRKVYLVTVCNSKV